MIKVNKDNLLKFLKEKDLDPKFQEETNQVYFVFKEDEREFPLFLRTFDNGDLLQLIAFFPIQLDQKVVPDTARLLHLLNKELDIPGFGLDEIGGVAFFRCMLNMDGGSIEESMIEKYVQTIRNACKTFGKTIEAVVVEAVTVDDLIKKAQDAVKGSS